jgi:hypothetical protein
VKDSLNHEKRIFRARARSRSFTVFDLQKSKFTRIVAEESVAQVVGPVGAAAPQVDPLVVGNANVSVAEVGRERVLRVVGRGGHRTLCPLECVRVEDVDVDGRAVLELSERQLLTVAAERVNTSAHHCRRLVHPTRTLPVFVVH